MIIRQSKAICMITAALSALTALLMTGCGQQATTPEIPPEPVIVYNDGVYLIEAEMPTVSRSDDGSTGTDIKLYITNNSLENLVLSKVLCLRVSSPEGDCQLIYDASPSIDGLIKPGERAEGVISVEMPVEPNSFTIELAVDYLDDQWISFEIAVPE